MRSKMLPLVAFAIVLTATLISNNCGGPANCPTCGTDKNATVGLIDVMLVPEHNGNGEPGGPFNIFDISWVDPVNRFYYVSDRVGLDVPVFNTTTNIALAAIGGDNSIAEAGNNASSCLGGRGDRYHDSFYHHSLWQLHALRLQDGKLSPPRILWSQRPLRRI